MKSPKRAKFRCLDCKRSTWNEYFMLYAKIWRKANPKFKGQLCVACVENRLGRKLSRTDFTTAVVNKIKAERSRKLISRLALR